MNPFYTLFRRLNVDEMEDNYDMSIKEFTCIYLLIVRNSTAAKD